MTSLNGIKGGTPSSYTSMNKTFSTSVETSSYFKRQFYYAGAKYKGGPSLFYTSTSTSYGAGGDSGNVGKMAAFELYY